MSDRAVLTEATDLISLYGDMAAFEAAVRADKSRSLGNVVQFCRWRAIERAIELLRDEDVRGSIH